MEFKGTKGKWLVKEHNSFSGEYYLKTKDNDVKVEEDKYNVLLISKAPEILNELNETVTDLKILRNQIADALKTNHLFEGMPELIDKWIDRKTELSKSSTEL
jgi:predicted choloylglycine hydrolase